MHEPPLSIPFLKIDFFCREKSLTPWHAVGEQIPAYQTGKPESPGEEVGGLRGRAKCQVELLCTIEISCKPKM